MIYKGRNGSRGGMQYRSRPSKEARMDGGLDYLEMVRGQYLLADRNWVKVTGTERWLFRWNQDGYLLVNKQEAQ